MLEDFKVLEKDVRRALVTSSVLLSRFRMLEEEYRKTPAYMDSTNFPFYYHLGKYISPKNVLEVGFDFGYRTGCFLQSCKSVENLDAIQIVEHGKYYNSRLGINNIKGVYKGKFSLSLCTVSKLPELLNNLENTYDLIIVNDNMNFDQYRTAFDLAFKVLVLNGLMVVGFVNDKCKDAFVATAKIHNRDFLIIPTRYGTGVMEK